VAPTPDALAPGLGWADAVLECIDAGTAVVAVAPCYWLDGTRLPLEVIAARCRAVGAALVVDGTQWVGAASLDVAALDPDFVVCAGYKVRKTPS
jgi:selenocysteine lyase/cysteine desulfurase